MRYSDGGVTACFRARRTSSQPPPAAAAASTTKPAVTNEEPPLEPEVEFVVACPTTIPSDASGCVSLNLGRRGVDVRVVDAVVVVTWAGGEVVRAADEFPRVDGGETLTPSELLSGLVTGVGGFVVGAALAVVGGRACDGAVAGVVAGGGALAASVPSTGAGSSDPGAPIQRTISPVS